MFVKTKDRGLAQTLPLNVCDAPKAHVGQIVTIALNLSLRDIAASKNPPSCLYRGWVLSQFDAVTEVAELSDHPCRAPLD